METPQNINRLGVLVLNKAFLAIDVVGWKSAITDWVAGTADIIDSYPDTNIRSGLNTSGLRIDIPVPSIIHRPYSSKNQHAMIKTLPFSRANLFQRDHGRCIYCKKALTMKEFTIEHVIPQSRGGLTDWLNCRVACGPCNLAKGSKLVSEMGWVQPKEVTVPSLTKRVPKNIVVKIGGRIPTEAWRPYIYWEWKLEAF